MGCHFLLPGDLPDPGIKPTSPVSSALAGGFFTTESLGKPYSSDFFSIDETDHLDVSAVEHHVYRSFPSCYLSVFRHLPGFYPLKGGGGGGDLILPESHCKRIHLYRHCKNVKSIFLLSRHQRNAI